ncbi:PAS domain-containing sensor histidine kinase [Clostridium ganghwense]|uniref:histidine kinase n=1 Tax=Clostridium ganghwense TaxID=312089 RepID=A0ABT4CQH3_9CLOT|nr:PAS domain S-box protein [Clostridium ganghwense]MCY6371297.1 PAS domain S-box protein [Clostridium ganghwense]
MFSDSIDMELFFYNIPTPIVVFDNNIEIININNEVINLCEGSLLMKSDNTNSYIKNWLEEDLILFKNDTTKESLCLEKYLKSNGKASYFKINFKKIFNDKFQLKNIIVVLNDITSCKLYEINLKKSEEHLRSVLQNMPIMMDAIDENDNITVWNKECELVTGYSKSEIIDNPKIWDNLYPDETYKEKILKQIREKDCDFRDLEYDIICKDGSRKTISWFNISKKFPIPGWHSWAFGIDVTNRKNTEEALRDSEERYRTFFNICPDFIYLVDINNNCIINANPAFLRKFGIKKEQISNVTFKHLIDDNSIDICKQTCLRLSKGEEFTGVNLRGKDVYGNSFDVEINCTPIIKNGRVVKILCCARDITERNKMIEMRKKAEVNQKLLKEAVEYEKLRTEFFANISHEFRTPLNVVLGSIQLMDMYLNNISYLGFYEKFSKLNKSMKQNCYRLIRLVNNLIDVTKIDSGFLELNLTNCDIVKIVKDITLSVSDFAKLKSLNLQFDSDIHKKTIACDPDKIERILLNLLSNAIKFTKEGDKISVDIQNAKDTVIITVQDSGIGIKEEDKKVIFERFRQVNKSLTRENEGSGIGLSLVKSLIEMHEGDIDVESEYEKGSKFIIKLPVKLVKDSTSNISSKNIQANKVEKISIEFSDIYF